MAGTEQELIVYVGCYTTPERGHGEGISGYRMDQASGAWQPLGLFAREVPNPSFLALHPNGQCLYSVRGGNFSAVSAFRISEDASLTDLGSVASGGLNPAHLDVEPSGRWL